MMSGFAINHRWAQWMADTVLVGAFMMAAAEFEKTAQY